MFKFHEIFLSSSQDQMLQRIFQICQLGFKFKESLNQYLNFPPAYPFLKEELETTYPNRFQFLSLVMIQETEMVEEVSTETG